MTHGITERDGVFAVRDAMWHGLGNVLEDYPTREEAQRIAHPWEPVTHPLYRRVIEMAPDGSLFPRFEEVESHVEVVRDDTGDNIGVVTSTHELVRNEVMYDIAEAIQGDEADVMFETGGSLLGGRKVWLLLRLVEPIAIVGDPNGATLPYYAIQNDHGGQGSFRGQSLMTRIVCDNTSQMADVEAQERGTEIVFRHTKNVAERIEEAKKALAGWRESVATYQRFQQQLLDVPVTASQVDDFIDWFVPMPPAQIVSERVQNNIHEARQQVWKILDDSPTTEGVGRTAYGLAQAAIEYGQHYRRARTDETRFKRAYLDRSSLVSDVYAYLAQHTGVSV